MIRTKLRTSSTYTLAFLVTALALAACGGPTSPDVVTDGATDSSMVDRVVADANDTGTVADAFDAFDTVDSDIDADLDANVEAGNDADDVADATDAADDSAADAVVEASTDAADDVTTADVAMSCADDSACAPDQYCASGLCVARMATGSTCTDSHECATNFCVDGVCCGTACTGACEACSAARTGSGADGTCGPIALGTDPDNECADQGSASCGTDGSCDGSGACRRYAFGTTCAAGSCSSGSQQNADTCDGSGNCVDGGSSMCAPYQCGATACLTSCTSDVDCVSTHYCAAGSCVARRSNGAVCTAANQCVSGSCVDGVCCNTACSGTCQACTTARKGAGADGVCGPIAAGTDPDNECATQPASSCGTNGSCNGSGACGLHATGTVCAAASCTTGLQQNADTCNGAGTCVDNGSTNCAPYVCNGAACRTSCAVDADCVSTHYCNGGACVPKLAQGTVCTTSAECGTGFCVDGVCCESACTGLCRSCSGAYNNVYIDGVCAPIEAADPQNECASTSICCSGICRSPSTCLL